MPTQVEMLKEALADLEQNRGPDAPFAKALRHQISSLESSKLDGPQPNPVTLGKR